MRQLLHGATLDRLHIPGLQLVFGAGLAHHQLQHLDEVAPVKRDLRLRIGNAHRLGVHAKHHEHRQRAAS